MGDFIFISGIVFIIVMFIAIEYITEKYKKKKIESSEIDVYRYYYSIVLSDGKSMEHHTIYSTLDFDSYSTCDILGNNTLYISKYDTVISTEHIVRVNLIKTEVVTINPIYCNSPFRDYDIYYTNKEVEERRIKQQ